MRPTVTAVQREHLDIDGHDPLEGTGDDKDTTGITTTLRGIDVAQSLTDSSKLGTAHGLASLEQFGRRAAGGDTGELVAHVLLHRHPGCGRVFAHPLPDGVVEALDVHIHSTYFYRNGKRRASRQRRSVVGLSGPVHQAPGDRGEERVHRADDRHHAQQAVGQQVGVAEHRGQ